MWGCFFLRGICMMNPFLLPPCFLCKFEVLLQICINFLRKKFLYHEKLCKFAVSPQNFIKNGKDVY